MLPLFVVCEFIVSGGAFTATGKIITSALAVHQCFPDIYAIAWNYVATPESTYLLEGNTGWGTRIPQMIQGGLPKNH